MSESKEPVSYHSNTSASSISFHLGQSEMFLEDAPCALYLIRLDADFTVLHGNSKFFELLGLAPERLRVKYGNRLGALVDAESCKALSALSLQNPDSGAFFYLQLHIRRHSGHERWLSTSATLVDYNGETAICCFSFDTTKSVLCRQKLSSSETLLTLLTKRSSSELFILDTATGRARIYTAHPSLLELFPSSGVEYPNFIDTLISNNIIAPESLSTFLEVFELLRLRDERTKREIRLRTGLEHYAWIHFSLEYRTMYGMERRYAVGILEDITQHRETMVNFLRETQFFQAMLADTSAYGQFDVTADRLLRCGGLWNTYSDAAGYLSCGAFAADFLDKYVHPDDRSRYFELLQPENYLCSLENGIDHLGCELRCFFHSDKPLWMALQIRLFRDSMSEHVMALLLLKNIDAEKKHQLSLLRDPERDRLTGVYSKRMAEYAIYSGLQNAHANELCVLAVFDVDNFRVFNSTYGYRAGDDILVAFSRLLGQVFRKNDIIGRFGGDEFLVLIKNILSLDRVKARLDALYVQLHQLDGPAFTVSAGIAPIAPDTTYDQLFRHADAALRAAKDAGKNRYAFFDETLLGEPDMPRRLPTETPSEALLPESIGTQEEAFSSFDSFMAENGDIAYLVDIDSYDLLCGNSAFYRRIGRTPEDCIGRKCYELMQGREAPCPFCARANWSTEHFYLWRNINQFLGQQYLVKNKLIEWEGREVLLAIAVDVSSKKSIADSLSGTSESHVVLSGIRQMSDAKTLPDAMTKALEVIGTFFQADIAQLWERPTFDSMYSFRFEWRRTADMVNQTISAVPLVVDAWLRGRNWNSSIFIESPNMMLGYSYEMYQLMRQNKTRNVLCIPLVDGDREMGCIMVRNLTANLRNTTFINEFSDFIVSERKRRELMEDILYTGSHDRLTDLLNRNSYDQYLYSYDGDGLHSLGVIFADLDGLKSINVRHGYQMGNELLSEFATMLRAQFPEHHVFRLNGDEFLVVAEDICQADLDARVRALCATVARSGQFNISVGQCWDNVEKNLAVMIENATQMMRVNKKRHYDAQHDVDHEVRSGMLQGLLLSLERREFEIFLQPKMDFNNRRLVGAEALVRYRDKERGIITPGHFIDMMERNDFIRYIDLFVFEEVCRLLQRWKGLDFGYLPISLNFSRLTLLENDIVSSVEDIFSQYRVPRKFIEIEVTESFADMGKSAFSQSVGGLYQSGFSISLDDFGTKYTNLSLLFNFEFNVLKLDKSLISSLAGEPKNQIILRSVIDMCSSLGIEVIAEGIETEEQEAVLRGLGCRLGQGYLYGKPMEVSEFEKRYFGAQQKNNPKIAFSLT